MDIDDFISFMDMPCPGCGGHIQNTRCWKCGGLGYRELYEKDPMWYDIDDIEDCDICYGAGWYPICPDKKCKVKPMTINEAYTVRLFPLQWRNEFGTYTVTNITYTKYHGFELHLAEPLADHEPETYIATVGDDVALFYTPQAEDTTKSLD